MRLSIYFYLPSVFLTFDFTAVTYCSPRGGERGIGMQIADRQWRGKFGNFSGRKSEEALVLAEGGLGECSSVNFAMAFWEIGLGVETTEWYFAKGKLNVA